MTIHHHIGILAFNGIQILDVTGPASVFAAANDAAKRDFYQVHILSEDGGLVQSNSAVAIASESIGLVPPEVIDTMLIAGGEEEAIWKLALRQAVKTWVCQTTAISQRFGAICTGSFLLAEFGLLKGKKVATHWSECAELAKRYPDLTVDENSLFVQDGEIWTSAGITTGIDMCLEIVSLDLGKAVANDVAKRLVLYCPRPGYQSQFSAVLNAQAQADAPFAELINWMGEHLHESLDVPRLAAQTAMSDRNFHRKFTALIGTTPAHFVETLRLDRTRLMLATRIPLKEIATETGYANAAQLSKAFERRFGMTAVLFREMHCSKEPDSGMMPYPQETTS